LTCEFTSYTSGNKLLHGFTGCWEAYLVLAAEVTESQDRAFAQSGKDAQGICGRAAGRSYSAGVLHEEIHEPPGGLNGAVGLK
jgi:hypothetical protein